MTTTKTYAYTICHSTGAEINQTKPAYWVSYKEDGEYVSSTGDVLDAALPLDDVIAHVSAQYGLDADAWTLLGPDQRPEDQYGGYPLATITVEA